MSSHPTALSPELDLDAELAREEAAQEQSVFVASQWQLMWWKFRKHRLAVISGVVILTIYAMVAICEFLAPYHYTTRHTDFIRAPRQEVHLFHEGSFVGRNTSNQSGSLRPVS